MDRGRVLRFDQAKGYGFIAPDSGGDDVFLHVNDLLTPDKHLLGAGAVVEFLSEQGDRGPKASEVRVLTPAPRAATVPVHETSAHEPSAYETSAHETSAYEKSGYEKSGYEKSGGTPTPGPGGLEDSGVRLAPRDADDEFVDVLPIEDFRGSLTESLLLVEPALTGPQVIAIRERVLAQARRYGWVTG